MIELFNISTSEREELVNITKQIRAIIRNSNIANGIVNIYTQGSASAIMIQESHDYSIQMDVISLMQKLVPRGIWKHDQQDANSDGLLKAGIIGSSETIPIIDGELGLTALQNLFFCEFDGPRNNRSITCTLISDK